MSYSVCMFGVLFFKCFFAVFVSWVCFEVFHGF